MGCLSLSQLKSEGSESIRPGCTVLQQQLNTDISWLNVIKKKKKVFAYINSEASMALLCLLPTASGTPGLQGQRSRAREICTQAAYQL